MSSGADTLKGLVADLSRSPHGVWTAREHTDRSPRLRRADSATPAQAVMPVNADDMGEPIDQNIDHLRIGDRIQDIWDI